MRSLVLLSLSLSLLVTGCGNPVDLLATNGAQGIGAGEDDPDSSEEPDPGDDGDGTPEEGDCTLTQGYWKNHEEWPVSDLTLGNATYTAAELDAILENETEGDASLILSHQLIAARLNQASGASVPSSVAAAMSDADAWLIANADADGRIPYGAASTDAHVAASDLATELDDFNQGLSGPGHCDGDRRDTGDGDDDDIVD